jgi:GTP pyrophosphokinase
MPYLPEYVQLRRQLAQFVDQRSLDVIDRAYTLAEQIHTGERRASGGPYLRHPVAVAALIASLHPDPATIVAALLHDVLEGKPYDVALIHNRFGAEVAQLVEGTTKLDRVQQTNQPWFALPLLERRTKERLGYERHVESLRKMILAMTRDIRVVLIKLADRLDNMRTLEALRADKRERIARDTLDIFAPIANRLGMGQWKGELEDLAFTYVYPTESAALDARIRPLLAKQELTIRQARARLAETLRRSGIQAEIHHRIKHRYSLFQKLRRHDDDLDRIYDLIALRVIVATEADCYAVLGLVHGLWKPLFGRIKDYVALPKPNGYRSLHTTVFGPSGQVLEIQVRTTAMHEQAERGIAAHWLYRERAGSPRQIYRRPAATLSRNELRWLEEIRGWQESLQDIHELKPILATDFFSDRIFCFTPAGDVVDLPTGSTAIDFAYQIHSALGNHCIGATADGRAIGIATPLENGQIVHIRTGKQQQPRRDWLRAVKTAKARSAIRTFLDTHADRFARSSSIP